MFKHKLPYIEFSLHAYLKEQGGEAFRYSCSIGNWQPIAYGDLVQNIVYGGEMRGGKVVIIRPCYDLSSNDYGDHWINVGYLYPII